MSNEEKETGMAKKTVVVCDGCGSEIEDGKGAVLRVVYNDARRGAKAADLCDACSVEMPGVQVARRGRKPRS
jgi:predicted metal-binding protein